MERSTRAVVAARAEYTSQQCVRLRCAGYSEVVADSGSSGRCRPSLKEAVCLDQTERQSVSPWRWRRRRHTSAAVSSASRKPSFLPACCRNSSFKVRNSLTGSLHPTFIPHINYHTYLAFRFYCRFLPFFMNST